MQPDFRLEHKHSLSFDVKPKTTWTWAAFPWPLELRKTVANKKLVTETRTLRNSHEVVFPVHPCGRTHNIYRKVICHSHFKDDFDLSPSVLDPPAGGDGNCSTTTLFYTLKAMNGERLLLLCGCCMRVVCVCLSWLWLRGCCGLRSPPLRIRSALKLHCRHRRPCCCGSSFSRVRICVCACVRNK